MKQVKVSDIRLLLLLLLFVSFSLFLFLFVFVSLVVDKFKESVDYKYDVRNDQSDCNQWLYLYFSSPPALLL